MSVSIQESREDQIRRRAYEIWLERVKQDQPGNAESDWHLAELELGAHTEQTPNDVSAS